MMHCKPMVSTIFPSSGAFERSALGIALAAVLATTAQAQSPAEFYKGKTIEVYIGTSAGGGYDAYSRILSRHMGRHMPGNPVLVPKNMTGGGGIRLANFLYNAAPKEGLAFGTFNRGIIYEPLFGNKSAQFDATRFNWIGSTNDEVSICVAWHTSGVARYQQVLERELVVGASGIGADTYQFPKVVNGVLGTKFKVVTGYPGGNDIDLAMERQEVQGRCSWSWSSVKATHPTWLPEKKFNVLFQMGLSKHPELADTPLIMDLAKTDEDRAIFKLMFSRQVMAWPFALPPGTPPDRIEALRAAFTATMHDQDFLADAAKAKFEIRSVTGARIQTLVQEIYATPASVVRKAVELLQ
jgi:tripartite-type tricarboxylate transporter receptor subunit TctC